MNQPSIITGTLKVSIQSTLKENASIPKQIQVLGADLSLKASAWITTNEWEQELPAGTYVVRLNFSSGSQLEQVVEMKEQQTTHTLFDIDQLATNQEVDWRHLIKSNAVAEIQSTEFRNEQKPIFLQNISGSRWSYVNKKWTVTPIDEMQDELITVEGSHYSISTSQNLELLELHAAEEPVSTFICLPPGQQIDLLLTAGEGPLTNQPKLTACITTTNYKAQSLLSLLASGDIKKARTLVNAANEAEQLLFRKMADPAAAAIGGYYLLKTGELDRMHDWAKNLAQRFNWFPDAQILYAWQLIQDKQEDTVSNQTIKSILLQAVQCGVPVYTEGLRLLYEAINMMAFEENHSDPEVSAACTLVRNYVNAADMSTDTTTFIGTSPDKPGLH